MEANTILKNTSRVISNSVSFKICVMVVLILLLLIPTSMVSSLIREREKRNHDVIAEIGEKW
ncbi:MAG: inner membrane CreD family protein, partial [Desulfobacterales bacterium]